MNDLFSLKDKRILVTGAGRGIGAALVRGLSGMGARVAAFEYRLPSVPLDDVKFYRADLRKKQEIEENFNQFLKDFGGVDVLINNAGITFSSPGEQYPLAQWQESLEINLTAVFQLCQLAGRRMIFQGNGGSIINVTSIGAEQGFPNNPAYAASKGGVKQLTKALASEWGQYGIRVNNLAPGYTHTPMNQKSWDDPQLKQARSDHTMLGRWAEPEDMVGPVIFLASDASRYVTGIDLLADGGWVSKGI